MCECVKSYGYTYTDFCLILSYRLVAGIEIQDFPISVFNQNLHKTNVFMPVCICVCVCDYVCGVFCGIHLYNLGICRHLERKASEQIL